jgi:hypothetical protein
MPYTITFNTLQEINLVRTLLGQQPHDVVRDLIASFDAQVLVQISVPQKEVFVEETQRIEEGK